MMALRNYLMFEFRTADTRKGTAKHLPFAESSSAKGIISVK